jgi:hypothetical protein
MEVIDFLCADTVFNIALYEKCSDVRSGFLAGQVIYPSNQLGSQHLEHVKPYD